MKNGQRGDYYISRLIDLTGQTFGRLTVMYRVDDYIAPSGHKFPRWHCKCSCEDQTEFNVNGSSLRRGLTQSCGCLQKEIASDIGKKTIKTNSYDSKKYNVYDLDSFEYGIGYTSNTNKPFMFDKEDYDLIKDMCWRENLTSGYIVTSYNGKSAYALHRYIMKVKDEECIDHINRKRNDNRKSNLRISTIQQNNCNKDNSNNYSSGHKGISWNKAIGKWETYIDKNYQRIRLGYFTDLNEAIRIREQAENEYFGEFSCINSNQIAEQNN